MLNDNDRRELEARFRGEIVLGWRPQNRQPVHVGLEALKQTSTHVIGAAGSRRARDEAESAIEIKTETKGAQKGAQRKCGSPISACK